VATILIFLLNPPKVSISVKLKGAVPTDNFKKLRTGNCLILPQCSYAYVHGIFDDFHLMQHTKKNNFLRLQHISAVLL